MDAVPGAVGTCLDYVAFLHDRLVVRAPGIVSASLTQVDPSGRVISDVSSSRVDIDSASFELQWRVPGIDDTEPIGRVVEVGRPASGTSMRLVVPPELALGPEMRRRISLYVLVVLSGLQADVGDLAQVTATPGQGRLLRSRRAGSHLERVAGYSHIIVRALTAPLGLTPDFADAVFRYAPLHDIGQLVFPDAVMQKPGRLEPHEWELMKSHTTRGRRIVDLMVEGADPDVVPRPDVLRNIVELHHEALDGSGYPHGLTSDRVPLEARIIMVADVFDALISKRPYKPGWSVEDALTEMDRMVDAGRLDGRCLTALATEPEVVEAVAASGAEPPRMMRA